MASLIETESEESDSESTSLPLHENQPEVATEGDESESDPLLKESTRSIF